MSQIVSAALIGYGLSGKCFHAPFLAANSGFRLAKIVTRSGRGASEDYPAAEIAADFSAVISDSSIDLVIVTTPNDSHVEIASAALDAGKHVVVEKPIAIHSDEAETLISLARKRGRILTVFQNRRWDGDFLTVRKIVEDRLLGSLVRYTARYDRFKARVGDGWRESGKPGSGMLYDLGSHLIDQALSLFGFPQSVEAELGVEREGAKAVDRFDLVLHYPSHIAALGCGMMVKEPGPHFLLEGGRGTFVKHGMDPQEDILRSGGKPGGPGWGAEPEARWGELDARLGALRVRGKIVTLPGDYGRFYANVHDAITAGAPLAVNPEEARDTLRVIELALQSARTTA